jgi:outer membrane protein assembly factor BamB
MPFHRYARVRGLARSASFVFAVFLSNALTAAAQTSVTTYHNDNYRTGWNNAETTPTPLNVNASQFGLLATVAVDDQVDAQPLLVSNVNITAGTHQGLHNVVYVVTGNDTVYAIDANAGTILLSNHLGTPVTNPLGCNNNGPHVGITSSPVINTSSNALYLIAYTKGSKVGGPPMLFTPWIWAA